MYNTVGCRKKIVLGHQICPRWLWEVLSFNFLNFRGLLVKGDESGCARRKLHSPTPPHAEQVNADNPQ